MHKASLIFVQYVYSLSFCYFVFCFSSMISKCNNNRGVILTIGTIYNYKYNFWNNRKIPSLPFSVLPHYLTPPLTILFAFSIWALFKYKCLGKDSSYTLLVKYSSIYNIHLKCSLRYLLTTASPINSNLDWDFSCS